MLSFTEVLEIEREQQRQRDRTARPLENEWYTHPQKSMKLTTRQDEFVRKNELYISTGYVGLIRIYKGRNGPVVFQTGCWEHQEEAAQRVRKFIDDLMDEPANWKEEGF